METTEDRWTGLWMETAAKRLLLLGFWVLVKKAEGSQGGAGAGSCPGPLCVSLPLRGMARLEHPGVSEGAGQVQSSCHRGCAGVWHCPTPLPAPKSEAVALVRVPPCQGAKAP